MKISDEKKRQIRQLAGKNISQAEIGRIVGVSVGSVNSIVKKSPSRGQVKPVGRPAVVDEASGRPGTPATSLASQGTSPNSPPDDVANLDVEALDPNDPELVKKWIAKVERQATKAETDGNIGAFASLTAKLVSLIEHARKAQPPPKLDPNDAPDMIAAKERARAEFHRLIDHKLISHVRS